MKRYTLQDSMDVLFAGFNIDIPPETIKFIEELTAQVGSPTYIKTPNFQKKEPVDKTLAFAGGLGPGVPTLPPKRRRRNTIEVVKDCDWESLRTFHATKLEQKVGMDAEIDLIRSYLNKMSNKNYEEMQNNIMVVLDKFVEEDISDEEMLRVSGVIFDIASNNRFYSKLYADLYSVLMNKYELMKETFSNSIARFMELFSAIEQADPEKDYDHFCQVNKNNETRKSLSAFFVNLCAIQVLSVDKIIELLHVMLTQVNDLIHQANKKSEVDEFTENIAILYDAGLMTQIHNSSVLVAGKMTIKETIEMFASCKAKDYKSFSSKAIFKYMDLVEKTA
jgi:hypothetical protein